MSAAPAGVARDLSYIVMHPPPTAGTALHRSTKGNPPPIVNLTVRKAPVTCQVEGLGWQLPPGTGPSEETDMGRSQTGSRQCRRAAGLPVALMLGCGISVALAQPVDLSIDRTVTSAPAARLEIERVDPLVDAPGGSTARLYRLDRTASAAVSDELRTRWWLGRGAGSIGAGADWAATPARSALRPWRPVLGLRADVGDHARLIYEVRGAAAPWASTGLPGAESQEVRVAMEFKSARSPAQNLRNGLLRVQLSNTSALMLKPRSGGLVVSYRSQF